MLFYDTLLITRRLYDIMQQIFFYDTIQKVLLTDGHKLKPKIDPQSSSSDVSNPLKFLSSQMLHNKAKKETAT